MDSATLSSTSRHLAAALEPIAGQVYFSPECHANYQALGFGEGRGVQDGVAMANRVAYFTSRGSVMGQVSGHVVAATFAVFNPDIVIPSVEEGWKLTDATSICSARDRGAIAQLERILGPSPRGVDRAQELLQRAVDPLKIEGRALFAGLRSLEMPNSMLGATWRLADMLREYRGDSHIAAWVSEGLDAVEVCLLTDAFSGLPMRTYSATRGWRAEQFDPATERLVSRGLLDASGETFTTAGRETRSRIELNTDRQMGAAMNAIEGDLAELMEILSPLAQAIKDAYGYPKRGPQEMAIAAAKTAAD
ncbi:MAG: hypothetical protein ABIQ38_03560 [Ilumatobacteraceae bacterium]